MQTELLASPNYTHWYPAGDMEPNIPEGELMFLFI